MKTGFFVSDYKLKTYTLGRIAGSDDALLLVANGVYHASVKEGGNASPILALTSNVYVLAEDLQTRGIAEGDLDSKVKVVTYGGLVDVVFNDYDKIAWL